MMLSSAKPIIAKLKMRGKPYAMQILAKSINKRNISMTVAQLEMHSSKYSIAMAKLLKSGLSNASNQGMDINKLIITNLSVSRGEFLKRRGFKGRGRTELVRKPHAKVFLKMEQEEVASGK